MNKKWAGFFLAIAFVGLILFGHLQFEVARAQAEQKITIIRHGL